MVARSQPRSYPSVGTVFKANCGALPSLAAGLQVRSMICCKENPGWINNLGDGTASDAYRLVRLVMWRHLVRGLPVPKIEPIFLPYDPRSEFSPTVALNRPGLLVKIAATISRSWGFLFKRHLADWQPLIPS